MFNVDALTSYREQPEDHRASREWDPARALAWLHV